MGIFKESYQEKILNQKKVVIAGAGFAGVYAALKLANTKGIKVVLISPSSYFEYHAALYRSATGRSPLEVAIPLEEFFSYAKNIEVVKDKALGIDEKSQSLAGESGANYHYDELILALGNSTAFYGIEGLEEHALGVKTIQEALRLKRHLHDHLAGQYKEAAYVVVGAGATGVELSAEMVYYLEKIRKMHGLKNMSYSIYLVEAGSRVLGNLPEKFSQKVEKRLKEIGVKILLNTAVKSKTAEEIQLPNKNIKTHTVVWTAGAQNNHFLIQHKDIFGLGKLKRVTVNNRLEGAPHIYVVGDAADTEYSGMAQTALNHAGFVASNIIREQKGKPLLSFQAKKPIYAVPVGAHWAAVLWGETMIFGRLGWVLRRAADLHLYLKFLPLRKAVSVWRYGLTKEEICPVCKH